MDPISDFLTGVDISTFRGYGKTDMLTKRYLDLINSIVLYGMKSGLLVDCYKSRYEWSNQCIKNID